MENKVPVRLFNIQNKSVQLLKGTESGKLTKATTKIQHDDNEEGKEANILGATIV